MAKPIDESTAGLIVFIERTYRMVGRLRERLLMDIPVMSADAFASLMITSAELEKLRARLIRNLEEDDGK